MFIGGLSWQTSAEGLREYFSKFGDVTEVMVMKDPTTRRSRYVSSLSLSPALDWETIRRGERRTRPGRVKVHHLFSCYSRWLNPRSISFTDGRHFVIRIRETLANRFLIYFFLFKFTQGVWVRDVCRCFIGGQGARLGPSRT